MANLRASASSPVVREVCAAVEAAACTTSLLELAGVLDGVKRVRQRMPGPVDVVWTGPVAGPATHRLTAAVVADLVDQAERSVLLVSYAMHAERRLREALEQAVAQRGVDVTLLAERPADNPRFDGPALAFPGLCATRLAWPSSAREPGASLHAKVMVIDERLALVGSANITQSAMERNLECGLLVRDPRVVAALAGHVDSLRAAGHLVSTS